MKKWLIIGVVALVFVLVALRLGWVRMPGRSLPVADPVMLKEDQRENGYKVEEVVSGLFVPWSIAFTSEERMLVTERNGRIRVVEGGKLFEQPSHVFSEVATGGEEGLMGLTLHPNYEQNKYFYVSLAYEADGKMWVKVVRLIDKGETSDLDRIILDKIPAAEFHAGNRLKFGPDGKLYITTGDATDRKLAQDKNSLAGKILRVNDDGSIPSDNPFEDSPIFSLGHRNPQGIAWHPATKQLFATEHGPSGFDGPGGGDELNLIKGGANYGWPEVSHEKSALGMESPLAVWTPAIAPAGVVVYGGKLLPSFKNNVFFGGLKGEGMFRVILNGLGDGVARWEKLPGIEYGRIREVVEGPEGAIYFSTSNRDGRGRARTGDDKIYKIVPSD